MKKESPDKKLLRVIRSMPAVDIQNRLMRLSDREIALSILYLSDQDRIQMYALIAPRKAIRIRQELAMYERMNINYVTYRTAIEGTLAKLASATNTGTLKSYIRPRSPLRRQRK